MNRGPLDRRSMMLGMAAVTGTSLLASRALAFPRGALMDFEKASRLLAPYGMTLLGLGWFFCLVIGSIHLRWTR